MTELETLARHSVINAILRLRLWLARWLLRGTGRHVHKDRGPDRPRLDTVP